MPYDCVWYALVMRSWLMWWCGQERAVLLSGGPQRAGLMVIQWGCAEDSRIERQLRGRAGRQGDPGSSYVLSHLRHPSALALTPLVQSVLHKVKPQLTPAEFHRCAVRSGTGPLQAVATAATPVRWPCCGRSDEWRILARILARSHADAR